MNKFSISQKLWDPTLFIQSNNDHIRRILALTAKAKL